MGIEHHYEPCFGQIPATATNRWTLLRDFLSQWHNLNLPLMRDCELAAKETEYVLNTRLPDSIREWIAFSNDSLAIDAFRRVLRDEYDVSRLNRFSATNLMIQGEGDIYWAVQDRYSDLADPPVDYYVCDDETDKGRFSYGEQEAKSLTSFVLSHMAYFLGTGFVRTLDVNKALIAEMGDAFPVASDFDGLRVFEMTDLISFVRRRGADQYTLIVARKNTLPESAMPACVRRMMP